MNRFTLLALGTLLVPWMMGCAEKATESPSSPVGSLPPKTVTTIPEKLSKADVKENETATLAKKRLAELAKELNDLDRQTLTERGQPSLKLEKEKGQ